MSSSNVLRPVPRALSRARRAILTIAAPYVVSVLVGAVMGHSGNRLALDYLDRLVARATATDPAAVARQEARGPAALLDFRRILRLGTGPNTVAGAEMVIPYPLAAFRGWVGGMVSVWSTDHSRRRANPVEAACYLLALIRQRLPSSLAGGAGVKLSIAAFRPRRSTGVIAGWAFRRKQPGCILDLFAGCAAVSRHCAGGIPGALNVITHPMVHSLGRADER